MTLSPYLYLLPVVPAMVMVFSDFKLRTVNVVWLTVFGIAAVGIGFMVNGIRPALVNFGSNMLLLMMMFGSSTVYWRIKYGRWENPVDRTIGSGDLVFLVCISFLFGIRTYLYILLVSMIVSLIWWAVKRSGSGEVLTVPLVGMTSIVVCLWLIKLTVGL